MKREYRRSNLFSMAEILEVLGRPEHITTRSAITFKDWDGLWKQLYKDLPSVKKWHIFEVEAQGENLTMSVKTSSRSVAPDETWVDMRSRRPNRDQILATSETTAIAKPKIKDIKQMELWKKWRTLVPEKYHEDEIYKEPSAEVKNQHKQAQAEKNKQKAAKKRKRLSTSSTGT